MSGLLSKLAEMFMSNIADALNLMVIGMGTVLLFLCIMIFAMFCMSKIVLYLNKIFPEAIPEVVKKPASKISDDADVAVAVLSAMLKK